MADAQWIIAFVARNVWNVWPALLISILLSVLIRALKLDSAIRSAFDKRVGWSVLFATAIGAFSPFCSCTVIPVISGLLLSGVPLAPVMAFWIASPLMDLEIFALTVATLGLPLALARLAATLLLSLGGGYLTLALSRAGFFNNVVLRQASTSCCTTDPGSSDPSRLSPPVAASSLHIPLSFSSAATALPTSTPIRLSAAANVSTATSCCATGMVNQPAERWWTSIVASLRAIDRRTFGREVLELSWSLGRWLVLAFVLEALILRYVPQQMIATVLGQDSFFAVPLAALVGIPMYLGNLSALPIVAGLLSQGMQPGAAIAFLIAGPVTTIPAMTAVWNVVERKVFALYLTIGVVGSILAGALVNLVLG